MFWSLSSINIRPETGYLSKGFTFFFNAPPEKMWGWYTKLGHDCPFHIYFPVSFSVTIVVFDAVSLVWLSSRVVKEITNKIADHQDSLSLNKVIPLNIITLYFLPSILILFSCYLAFSQTFCSHDSLHPKFHRQLSLIHACCLIKEQKNHKYWNCPLVGNI